MPSPKNYSRHVGNENLNVAHLRFQGISEGDFVAAWDQADTSDGTNNEGPTMQFRWMPGAWILNLSADWKYLLFTSYTCMYIIYMYMFMHINVSMYIDICMNIYIYMNMFYGTYICIMYIAIVMIIV